MRYEHKAIIDAAARDGKFPMEVARELLGHDLLKSMVTTISSHAVAFKNMTEQQQDSAIKTMQDDLTPALDTAIRMIVSQATKTVRMKLKKVAIGKKWQIIGEAEGDEEFLHELADKTQDQSDVLVLLYERDYLQGLDAISGEKDQQALPLDGETDTPASGKKTRAPKAKAEDKPIDLPPKLIADARDFVTIQQNCQISGLQNHLKIGFQKGEALLKILEEEGLLKFVGTDQSGQYELVRSAPVVTTEQGEKVEIDPETAKVFYATAVKAVMKAGSADDSVMRAIYGDDDNAIEVALMAMEEDGIVSAPSPEGLRDVLVLPGEPAE